MAIPPCGTFHYAGVAPDTRAARESGCWRLKDKSGASSITVPKSWQVWKFWKRDANLDPLIYNRLIGLQPTLRISGGQLILEAGSRHRASIRSATLEFDRSLIDSIQGGDVLTLVRTQSTHTGVSLLRSGRLILAVGAVTAVPLGDDVVVRNGHHSATGLNGWRYVDPWVDISVMAETRRLREGEDAIIGNYRCTVIRCFLDGIPWTYECLAISLEGACPHDAIIRSAERFAKEDAGLFMTGWT
jgi:hypothetical protein